jgi:hypothetical protein
LSNTSASNYYETVIKGSSGKLITLSQEIKNKELVTVTNPLILWEFSQKKVDDSFQYLLPLKKGEKSSTKLVINTEEYFDAET